MEAATMLSRTALQRPGIGTSTETDTDQARSKRAAGLKATSHEVEIAGTSIRMSIPEQSRSATPLMITATGPSITAGLVCATTKMGVRKTLAQPGIVSSPR